MKDNFFDKLKKANEKVEKHKMTSAEKAAQTRLHVQRMADMQRYIDMSSEKRELFMDVVKNARDENGVKIIDKGIVVYVRLLDVLDVLELMALEENTRKEGIEHMSISGSKTLKQRGKIEDWFCSSPQNKIIFITDAGGQSLNLHATNEIILYDIPNGYAPFKQTIGRVARGFGKYDTYNIHIISIEDSMDEYKQILVSSRKELEMELLSADSIPLKGVDSFNMDVLKKIRKRLLWKEKK